MTWVKVDEGIEFKLDPGTEGAVHFSEEKAIEILGAWCEENGIEVGDPTKSGIAGIRKPRREHEYPTVIAADGGVTLQWDLP